MSIDHIKFWLCVLFLAGVAYLFYKGLSNKRDGRGDDSDHTHMGY